MTEFTSLNTAWKESGDTRKDICKKVFVDQYGYDMRNGVVTQLLGDYRRNKNYRQ